MTIKEHLVQFIQRRPQDRRANDPRDGDAGSGAVVAAADLTRVYGRGDSVVHALRGVSVEFPRGQFAAVMGSSGSGKSTLMHVLAGLDAPDTGTVRVDGVELTALDERRLTLFRRRSVGFVFQFYNLLPTLSAAENIALPSRIAGRRIDPSAIELMARSVGLDGRLARRPAELSGGQQQRVAVARALISRPAVVFADEPTGNLDSRSGGEVLGLLRRAADDGDQTIVMVTHDPRAAAVADRVVFLEDGLIVADREALDAGQILETMNSIRDAA
jgi:putative ABC transport system ATP-binding protein